jgi:hypothetical protein
MDSLVERAAMSALRTMIATLLIKAGMAILPKDVYEVVRWILLYHVPGALTESEKVAVDELARQRRRP